MTSASLTQIWGNFALGTFVVIKDPRKSAQGRGQETCPGSSAPGDRGLEELGVSHFWQNLTRSGEFPEQPSDEPGQGVPMVTSWPWNHWNGWD